MKRRVRLTESDLHRIVKESVKRVLRESMDTLDDFKSFIESNSAAKEAILDHYDDGDYDEVFTMYYEETGNSIDNIAPYTRACDELVNRSRRYTY